MTTRYRNTGSKLEQLRALDIDRVPSFIARSADGDEDDEDDPAEGADDDGSEDMDDELERGKEQDAADDEDGPIGFGPELDFARKVVVPMYHDWKQGKGKKGAETPGQFAKRAAASLRTRPDAKAALEAVGDEPEWSDWIVGVMRYMGEESHGHQGAEPETPDEVKRSVEAALAEMRGTTQRTGSHVDFLMRSLDQGYAPDGKAILTGAEALEFAKRAVRRGAERWAAWKAGVPGVDHPFRYFPRSGRGLGHPTIDVAPEGGRDSEATARLNETIEQAISKSIDNHIDRARWDTDALLAIRKAGGCDKLEDVLLAAAREAVAATNARLAKIRAAMKPVNL